MNSMRYRGKTWKVGDLVEAIVWVSPPAPLGHILKLHKEECQDAHSVGLFSYTADVIWQNGEVRKIELDYLEFFNE